MYNMYHFPLLFWKTGDMKIHFFWKCILLFYDLDIHHLCSSLRKPWKHFSYKKIHFLVNALNGQLMSTSQLIRIMMFNERKELQPWPDIWWNINFYSFIILVEVAVYMMNIVEFEIVYDLINIFIHTD